VVYAAVSGCAGRPARRDSEDRQLTEPSAERSQARAITFGLIGIGLAAGGPVLRAARGPDSGKGKGEGIPIHTYGVLVGGRLHLRGHRRGVDGRCASGRAAEGLEEALSDLRLAFYTSSSERWVGSRVLFIIGQLKDYASDPSKIFSLSGGLVFYGGLIRRRAHRLLVSRRRTTSTSCGWRTWRCRTVSLGHALGRQGCFSAGCCWGDVAARARRWRCTSPARWRRTCSAASAAPVAGLAVAVDRYPLGGGGDRARLPTRRSPARCRSPSGSPSTGTPCRSTDPAVRVDRRAVAVRCC